MNHLSLQNVMPPIGTTSSWGPFGQKTERNVGYPHLSFGKSGERGQPLQAILTLRRGLGLTPSGRSARGEVISKLIGSGHTGIAAERTGRRCYGLELDSDLCRHNRPTLAATPANVPVSSPEVLR